MKSWLAPLALGALLASPPAAACGDKFLVVGRGTRFSRRSATGRTPTVLFFAPPTSPLPVALRDASLDAALHRAGWAPARAASLREAEELLVGTGADVVLAAEADARLLDGRAAAAVVPVLVDPSPSELAAARREWGVVLATPVRRSRLLDALDEAVERRQAAGVVALRGR